MVHKCIMILLDGLGDRSYPQLNHCTPLQAARTPALDRLAREGASGLYHAAGLGQALPSENAHFAMFGYDMAFFPGRGALEALGAGIAFDSCDVALLAHFVSTHRDGDILILDNGVPQISDAHLHELFQAIGTYNATNVQVRLQPTHGFRGILTLAGDVAPHITDSDPMVKNRPLVAVQPWADYAGHAASCNTARALSEYLAWVYHTLKNHPVNTQRRKAGQPPVNALVTQRAGQLKSVPQFSEAYGMRGLSIASGIVYHGLASYLGMAVEKIADTVDAGNDMAERLKLAIHLLPQYDFIHVHTKRPDEAAHTKNPEAKCRVIEAIDRGIASVLEELAAMPDLLIVVAADHSTPSAGPLIHSGEAVPLIFNGPGIRRDAVTAYDEISAAPGALGLVRGKELMYLILNHLDRAKLHGLMDTPIDQPYWPGHYEPFRLKHYG